MIKYTFLLIISVITFSCTVRRMYNNNDKKIVKKYCYSCHSPSQTIIGQPLIYMYPEYGEKKLKKLLKRDFQTKQNKIINHENIILSNKEIKSIILSLKYGYIDWSRKKKKRKNRKRTFEKK